VETLPVDRDDRACIAHVGRGREFREVYVSRELGERMSEKLTKALEEGWIQAGYCRSGKPNNYALAGR